MNRKTFNKHLTRLGSAFMTVCLLFGMFSPAVYAEGEGSEELPAEETAETPAKTAEATAENETDPVPPAKEEILSFDLSSVPSEAENSDVLPDTLPAEVKDRTEPVDAEVIWTETETAYTVAAAASVKKIYTLSEKAEKQLRDTAVAKKQAAPAAPEPEAPVITETPEPEEKKEEKPEAPAEEEESEVIIPEEESEDDTKTEDTVRLYNIDAESHYMGIDLSADKQVAEEGDLITITVTLQSGYYCTGVWYWTEYDTTRIDLNPGADGTYTFTMPAANVSVRASAALYDPIKNLRWVRDDQDRKTPVLAWDPVEGAVSYKVQYGEAGTPFADWMTLPAAQTSIDLSDQILDYANKEGHGFVYVIGSVYAVFEDGTTTPTQHTSRDDDLEVYQLIINYDDTMFEPFEAAGWHFEGFPVTVTAVTKDGYEFEKFTAGTYGNEKPEEWTEGETSFTFTPSRNGSELHYYLINAYAKAAEHTVTFYKNDGTDTVIETQTVSHGDKAKEPSGKPERSGYSFTGWFQDPGMEDMFFFSNPITEDTPIYAGWVTTTPVQVTVDFGSGHDDLTAAYAEAVMDFAEDENLTAFVLGAQASGSVLTLTVNKSFVWAGDPVKMYDVFYVLKFGSAYLPDEFNVYEYRDAENKRLFDDTWWADGFFGTKASYATRDEFQNDIDTTKEKEIKSGAKLYAVWQSPVGDTAFMLETPKCGTAVTKATRPVFTKVSGDLQLLTDDDLEGLLPSSAWLEGYGGHNVDYFEGTMVGDKTYKVYAAYQKDIMHYWDGDFTVTVNGEEADLRDIYTSVQGYIVSTDIIAFSIKAEHEFPEEPTYEWAADNSTVTGKYHCVHFDTCGEKEETVTATQKITKEPTETEPGIKTYTGVFTEDPFETQTKEVALPPLEKKYSLTEGDGSTWTIGSEDPLTFRFASDKEDDETYSLFLELQIDGATVSDDSFTARPGSVIVSLKPEYLETLGTGSHSIKAVFSDGGSASGTFSIAEKAEPEPEPKPDKKDSSGGSSGKKPSTPVDNVVTCQMAGYPANYSWNESAKACQPGYLDAGGNFHPYSTAKKAVIPNTADPENPLFWTLAFFSFALLSIVCVKLLHEDWEA